MNPGDVEREDRQNLALWFKAWDDWDAQVEQEDIEHIAAWDTAWGDDET